MNNYATPCLRMWAGLFLERNAMASGKDKQFRWSQSIPEDWVSYLDAEAKKADKTRVGFVRDLIMEAIPEKYHSKLSQPQSVGRPSNETK
jgi:hypothetical protein